jgi:hypothetical protein
MQLLSLLDCREGNACWFGKMIPCPTRTMVLRFEILVFLHLCIHETCITHCGGDCHDWANRIVLSPSLGISHTRFIIGEFVLEIPLILNSESWE